MIDLDKLFELEAQASPGPYKLTDYKKLSACNKLVPYSLSDLELDVLMRNSIKELCTELKAAREVVEAAKEIEKYYFDDKDELFVAYDKLTKALENLDKVRRG